MRNVFDHSHNRVTDIDQRTSKIIALLHEKVRLEPWHRWILYLVFAAIWLSGGLWLVLEWVKDQDLGPMRTPMQVVTMKVHGAAILVYLALLGTLFTHVRRGFALRSNRVSGSLIIGANVVLTLSAWLLYYVTSDSVRDWSSALHWAVGLSILPLLCVHVWMGQVWSATHANRNR